MPSDPNDVPYHVSRARSCSRQRQHWTAALAPAPARPRPAAQALLQHQAGAGRHAAALAAAAAAAAAADAGGASAAAQHSHDTPAAAGVILSLLRRPVLSRVVAPHPRCRLLSVLSSSGRAGTQLMCSCCSGARGPPVPRQRSALRLAASASAPPHRHLPDCCAACRVLLCRAYLTWQVPAHASACTQAPECSLVAAAGLLHVRVGHLRRQRCDARQGRPPAEAPAADPLLLQAACAVCAPECVPTPSPRALQLRLPAECFTCAMLDVETCILQPAHGCMLQLRPPPHRRVADYGAAVWALLHQIPYVVLTTYTTAMQESLPAPPARCP